jgi:hypothetical protein
MTVFNLSNQLSRAVTIIPSYQNRSSSQPIQTLVPLEHTTPSTTTRKHYPTSQVNHKKIETWLEILIRQIEKVWINLNPSLVTLVREVYEKKKNLLLRYNIPEIDW